MSRSSLRLLAFVVFLGATGAIFVYRALTRSNPPHTTAANERPPANPAPPTPASQVADMTQRDPLRRVDSAPLQRPESWSSEAYEAVLEELREVLPDNAYWKWAAPTRDADTLGRRQARNQRMARQRAKIEANLADEEETRAFYAQQWRDSTDYIAFFQELLARRGGEMTDRDVGLARRAIEIHQTRLAWIPRRIDDAIARRAAYVERKSRWIAAGKPSGLEWDTGPSEEHGSR